MKLYRSTLKNPIVFPGSVIITAENLDLIDYDKVIYCEITPKGAMGNEGGILIYVLNDDDTLITYEINVKIDAKVYDTVSERITENKILFDNFYGGMGNHVFIKKGILIEIDRKNNCFWCHLQSTKLRINSSVNGVFLNVAADIQKTWKKDKTVNKEPV